MGLSSSGSAINRISQALQLYTIVVPLKKDLMHSVDGYPVDRAAGTWCWSRVRRTPYPAHSRAGLILGRLNRTAAGKEL
jgi:hypothetical protein